MDVMKCIYKVNEQGIVMIQMDWIHVFPGFFSFYFCFEEKRLTVFVKGQLLMLIVNEHQKKPK